MREKIAKLFDVTLKEVSKLVSAGIIPEPKEENDIAECVYDYIRHLKHFRLLNDMAALLSLTPRRVQQLAKDGIISKGERGIYNLAETIRGYVKFLQGINTGGADLHAERTRLTKINADRKQLDLEKARGELINVDMAMKIWGGVVSSARTRILAIPNKLAPLVVSVNDVAEIKETVEEFIYEVLNELANPNLEKIERMANGLPGGADVSSAPKTKRKRVGGPKKKIKPGKLRGTRAVSNG